MRSTIETTGASPSYSLILTESGVTGKLRKRGHAMALTEFTGDDRDKDLCFSPANRFTVLRSFSPIDLFALTRFGQAVRVVHGALLDGVQICRKIACVGVEKGDVLDLL